ncbi:MAG: ribonuclease P protein component [Rhodospirillales bacterium]|nr:ribonuclease P protein component [Rhodospirillales bacterium]
MAQQLDHLRTRAEFLRVVGRGQKWATPGLVIRVVRREAEHPDDAGRPRLGLIASKKVGSAVARNRVKRRLRALANELLPEHGKPGTDYVLIGRSATVERRFEELRQDLLTALERVHKPGRGHRP